jgi:hypothetical protein
LTLDTVERGIGAGGGETIVTGLWFLLLSWAALQARALPRLLNYLGMVVGLAGILYVFTASDVLLAVNALGLIIWFVWLGIVMLRRSPVSVALRPVAGHAVPGPVYTGLSQPMTDPAGGS